MKEMSDLFRSKAAVGGNYNLTRDNDGLVRRLIEQITVHESGTFTVEFKSGTMVEV